MLFIILGKIVVLQSRVREIREHGSFRGNDLLEITMECLL